MGSGDNGDKSSEGTALSMVLEVAGLYDSEKLDVG